MVTAIYVHHTGGPEVMIPEEVTLGAPQAGEVVVRHTAIGVNYVDTYFRSGLYKTALPFTPGDEAAGVVEAVGDGVTDVKPGDRVVYVHGLGAYAEKRIVPAAKLIPIPEGVTDEIAAASLLKGMTAQYLLRQTFVVGPQHSILFHAAAGGVGLIAGQWARHLGARIIGTAGSSAKVELALHNGYDHVINYSAEAFGPRALELNGGRFDVVYDSVGKDTFMDSLDILKPRGLIVAFGQASGKVEPFDIGILNTKGSLYITRPTLGTYTADRESLLKSAAELFGLIKDGVITVPINQRFALKDAQKAHEALQGRATTGTTLLIP